MTTRDDALRLLEKTLAMEPHTLTGVEALRDLSNWDSMATIMFIAMADKELGLRLNGSQVARCRTVGELLALLGIAPLERAA